MSATAKQNQTNENDKRSSLFEVGFVKHHVAGAAGEATWGQMLDFVLEPSPDPHSECIDNHWTW